MLRTQTVRSRSGPSFSGTFVIGQLSIPDVIYSSLVSPAAPSEKTSSTRQVLDTQGTDNIFSLVHPFQPRLFVELSPQRVVSSAMLAVFKSRWAGDMALGIYVLKIYLFII